MAKVDLEKLICSTIEYFESQKTSVNGLDFFKFNHYINIIQKLLKEQGLEYKDGKLIELDTI